MIISSIKQNGISITKNPIPLTYKWTIGGKKEPAFKPLASYVKTENSAVETHYRPKINVTTVMTKPVDLDDNDDGDEFDLRPTKEKLSGVHLIELKVEGGMIKVSY